MAPAGELSLPIETLHHIGQYLSVEDILNLSRTCHYLRSAFNDNTIWKRYVSGKMCQLELLDQQVQPVFQCAVDLSPLCEYRLHYMRKVHLVNNWRNGNFVKYSSQADYWYSNALSENIKGTGPNFYNNRYIFLGRFINDYQSDGIAVWDVNETPVLHSFLPVKNVDYRTFYLVESKLVVVECIRVYVYEITLPAKDIPLLYSFIINKPEVSWQEEAIHFACDEGCVGWSYYLVDHYLISNQCGDEGNVFYVWDILNATKVGTFVTPTVGFGVSINCHEGDDWILQEYQRSGTNTLFFSFNINSQTFSDTCLEIEKYVHHKLCYKSQVFLFKEFDEDSNMKCKVLCTVYNCKTLTQVNNQAFINVRKHYGISSRTVIVHDKFVILCLDSVRIVNAQSLEIVGEIQCNMNVDSISHQFSFYRSFLIVIVSGDDYKRHVWDVEKEQKLPESLELAFSYHSYANDVLSKIVSLGYHQVKVTHFW